MRTLLQLCLLFAVFLGGIWLSRLYDLSVSLEPAARAAAASEQLYQPSFTRAEGPTVVLLFVGSSTCRWSTDPELPDAVEAFKLQLSEYAGEREMAFRAIGVSVDWSTEQGLGHLDTFGRFDEVSTGGNWANSTLLSHVWERGQRLATPAVFVFGHELVTAADSASGVLDGMSRSGKELLLARTGLDEIKLLVALGPERVLGGTDIEMPGAEPGDRSKGAGS